MNEFEKANVHELYSILRLVDIKTLAGANLDFMLDWATGGTYESQQYSANIIIHFLNALGDR